MNEDNNTDLEEIVKMLNELMESSDALEFQMDSKLRELIEKLDDLKDLIQSDDVVRNEVGGISERI